MMEIMDLIIDKKVGTFASPGVRLAEVMASHLDLNNGDQDAHPGPGHLEVPSWPDD